MNPEVEEWRRAPGRGKYAKPEMERRFLVASMPATSGPPRLIEDRYLDDTSLRLRRVSVGAECVFKLTQKVRAVRDDPAEVATTNIYLTVQEYAQFLRLPGAVIEKRRHVCLWQDSTYVVDEFLGRLKGLRLAEIEVLSVEAPMRLPSWAGREVTHVERFSGGALARAGHNQIEELLNNIGQLRDPR